LTWAERRKKRKAASALYGKQNKLQLLAHAGQRLDLSVHTAALIWTNKWRIDKV